MTKSCIDTRMWAKACKLKISNAERFQREVLKVSTVLSSETRKKQKEYMDTTFHY